MQHEQLQSGIPTRLRPPQHLDVTRRAHVASGEDRPPADVFTDADRLPLLVVEHLQVRQHHQFQLAVGRGTGRLCVARAVSLTQLRGRPRGDDVLWTDSIPGLCRRPHEVDAAARTDPDPEIVAAQQRDQLLHRLIGDVAIGHVEHRMPGRGEKVSRIGLELLLRHTGERVEHQVEEILLAETADEVDVAREQRGIRLLMGDLRLLLGQRPDPIDEEHPVHDRLLADERAVVVEHGYPLRHGHEGVTVFPGDFFDEVENGLLGGLIIPTRQGVDGGHGCPSRLRGRGRHGRLRRTAGRRRCGVRWLEGHRRTSGWGRREPKPEHSCRERRQGHYRQGDARTSPGRFAPRLAVSRSVVTGVVPMGVVLGMDRHGVLSCSIVLPNRRRPSSCSLSRPAASSPLTRGFYRTFAPQTGTDILPCSPRAPRPSGTNQIASPIAPLR